MRLACVMGADALIAREVDRRAGLLTPELTAFHDSRVRLALDAVTRSGGSEAEVLMIFIRVLTNWPD